MAKVKLGDKVVINATKYQKEIGGDIAGFPVSSLLNPSITNKILSKVDSQEEAEVIFLERLVADIKFADGFVATVNRKSLDFLI